MAYTEWYVVGPTGSDLNSGSTNQAPYTYSNCNLTLISGTDYELYDAAENGFAFVVGDIGVWDTATNKETFVVTEIQYSGSDYKLKVELYPTPGGMNTNTGKNVKFGGPWATIGHALDMVAQGWTNSDGDPPRINIARNSGTAYDEEGLDNNAFTVTETLTVEGYNTTPGDIDWTTSTDRVLIEPTSPSEAQVLYSNAPYVIWKNIYFSISGANKFGVRSGSGAAKQSWLNCKFYSEDWHGFYPSYLAHYVAWCRCDFSDCGSNGIQARPGSVCAFAGCRFANNAGSGLYKGANLAIINSLIYGNGEYGIADHNDYLPAVLAGNIIADNGSGGIDIGDPGSNQSLSIWLNNIIADNGGPGLDESWSSGKHIFGAFDFNCFHGNTTPFDDTYFIDTSEHNLTDEPWQNTTQGDVDTPGSRIGDGDYRTTAAMQAAGFPGLMPDTTITSDEGFTDLGPLQHEDAGGGGGAGGTRVIGPGTVVG